MEDYIMKKITLFLLFSVLLLTCFMLIACNEKTSPVDIDEFYDVFADAESVEFGMELNSSDSNMVMLVKIENDKSFYYEKSAYFGETTEEFSNYTGYEGDYLYTYSQKNDGTWERDYGHYAPENNYNTENALGNYTFLTELFNGKNYEYSKDYHLFLGRANLTITDEESGLTLSDIELELKEGNCTINSKATMDGYSMDFKFYVKNLNSTKVDLPEI